MVYVDPQKARQERDRQERERQAKLKAERERQAKLKAEKERQAKLKAERDRKARLKAEEERKAKADPKDPDKKADPKAKKPQKEKKPDEKIETITWSKRGQTNPIYGPSAPIYSSLSPIHSSISPIAQLPETELTPKAPLNRGARTWTGEKAEEPKPEPTLQERITAAKIKAISQQETEQQQKLNTILNDPKSTPTQRQTAKVLSARLKAATIQQALPSDQVTLLTLLPNSQTNYQKPLFNQWLDGSKARLGPGDEKGLEQYYTDNSRTLKTLEWIINSAQKPDQPQSQRFKPYLAPTGDPNDKVELIALKNGSLKDLVNKDDPNHKNVWVNGDQIVRAITKTNAQGKPVTEYFVPKNGSEVHGFNSTSTDPQQQQQKQPTEWVKITPPTEDQKIVSVDATELTQGKQPTSIKSTVNISGAEAQTHKRYNANSQRYEDYTNPIFTEYQQLRGDTPRTLSGSNLRNEIGMAMFNSSLGFTPNNAPQPGTPEAELLKEGKWQGDLFNGTTLPEQYKHLPPEQQKQKQEQFKRQQETIARVEATIKEVGGDNANVTTLPITVDVTDAKTILQLPLFRVAGKDGKDRFVDENGRLYQDMADWKANNKLPPGRVSYFADGHINDPNQKPNIITENSHAVIDTTGERVKSVTDAVLPWLGIAAGALLIASGVGAPIGAGLLTAATLTTMGVAGYGISQGVGTLQDRAAHGQSNTDLTDAEVRGTWLGLTADSLSMFAVGSALRLGKGGLSMVDEVGTVGKVLNVGAQYADTAAIGNSTVDLARNWDRLTPEQQLASIGQLGFWATMTGVSAKNAGGIENLYGAKSIRETFGGGRGQTPKERVTPTAIETVQPVSKATQSEPRVKSPEIMRREQELVQALPKRQQVPVEIDPNLAGNAVRVHYSVDKKGQIVDIQIKAGAQATPKDIELHAGTVKRMQQYSGMSRHVQQLKDKWKAWRNDHGVPPVGSKAWEAQLEISKLPDIIQERVERLSNADLDPKSQKQIKGEIEDLKEQLTEHQKTFKMMDKDPGKGFVAAKDRKEKDFSDINFRKIFDSISSKSMNGLSPQEIEKSFLLWKQDMASTAKVNGKYGDFEYGSLNNPNLEKHHAINSHVDQDGTLEFTIASTDKDKRREKGKNLGKVEETGADLFARMMIFHRGKVKRIKAHWTDYNEQLKDNFETFKENQRTLNDEQAAKQTFTGRMAEKFGFGKVSKIETIVDRMGFEHILITFEE